MAIDVSIARSRDTVVFIRESAYIGKGLMALPIWRSGVRLKKRVASLFWWSFCGCKVFSVRYMKRICNDDGQITSFFFSVVMLAWKMVHKMKFYKSLLQDSSEALIC